MWSLGRFILVVRRTHFLSSAYLFQPQRSIGWPFPRIKPRIKSRVTHCLGHYVEIWPAHGYLFKIFWVNCHFASIGHSGPMRGVHASARCLTSRKCGVRSMPRARARPPLFPRARQQQWAPLGQDSGLIARSRAMSGNLLGESTGRFPESTLANHMIS